MNYNHEKLLADFAERTLHNLRLIREIEKAQPERKAFEVTQLINSLLGLLVFPKENYLDQVPDKTIDELKAEGWPIPDVSAEYNQAKGLKDFVRLMRNGVAHFNVEFLSSQRNEITGIRIWNINRQREKDWEAELTLEDIEIIALRFISLLTGKDINMQNENVPITWQRALIRSGFYFQAVGEKFDFSGENEPNREYLQKILDALSQQQYFDGRVFSPRESTIDEAEWLAAVDKAHGPGRGGEAGCLQSQLIRLEILDTYIAGVVRWLNVGGFETVHSCDGHTTQAAELRLMQRELAPLLGYFLSIMSDDEWKYTPIGRLFLRGNSPHSPSRNRESASPTFERIWLLDVAEALHSRQDELRDFVRAAQRLKPSAQ